MSDFFDIRTLSLSAGIINLIILISMVYIYRTGKTYKGFLQWTLASLFGFIGMILLSLRGYLPDFITIILANLSISLYMVFITHGIRDFIGKKGKTIFYLLPVIFLFVTFLYYTYFSPNVNVRIIIITSIILVFNIWAFFLVIKDTPAIVHRINFLLLFAFGVKSIWYIIRIVYTINIESQIMDFMSASVIQGSVFIIIIGSNVTTMVGVIILNFQKVEIELRDAIDEVKALRGIIPICSSCKKIRDDKGYWNLLEQYIESQTDASFSHGICPECADKLYGHEEWYKKKKKTTE